MEFSGVDKLIRELDANISSAAPSDFLQSRLAGLVSVQAVAAYELIITNTLVEYCSSRDSLFGKYIEKIYARKKGRITTKDLKENHLSLLGADFVTSFQQLIEQMKHDAMNAQKPDPVSNYDSIIACRHKFVHEEQVTLSYDEAKNYFENGKNVVNAFQQIFTVASNLA